MGYQTREDSLKEMNYIINHKRFKKKYSFNELDKYLWSEKRISKFPFYKKVYFDFFNGTLKKIIH